MSNDNPPSSPVDLWSQGQSNSGSSSDPNWVPDSASGSSSGGSGSSSDPDWVPPGSQDDTDSSEDSDSGDDGVDLCDGFSDRVFTMMNGGPMPTLRSINTKKAKMTGAAKKTGAAEKANTATSSSAHGTANSMPDAPQPDQYKGLGKTGFESYTTPRVFLDARTPEGRKEVLKLTGIAVTPINNREAALGIALAMNRADPDGSLKVWHWGKERYTANATPLRKTLLSAGYRNTYDKLKNTSVSLFGAIYPGMDEDGNGGGGMRKHKDEMSLIICAFRAVLKVAEKEGTEQSIQWFKGGVLYTIRLPSVIDIPRLNAK